MLWSNATKNEKRQVEVLRQIQNKLDHSEQPTPRDVGLTEKEFQEMAAEKQFRLEKLEEDGPILENYVICELLAPALILLAKTPSPTSPIERVQTTPPPQSLAAGIAQGAQKGFLGVARIVLNSLVSGIVGYLIGKYLH
jgi:hypothetical protein